MVRHLCTVVAALAPTWPVLAEWSLHDHLDRVVAYDSQTYRELTAAKPDDLRGLRAGRITLAALPQGDGLRPYAAGMEVNGELRRGQLLFSGESETGAVVAAFAVRGGTFLALDYGLCDRAREVGNTGTRLVIEVGRGEGGVRAQLLITETLWQTHRVALPPGEAAWVRLSAYRRGGPSTNWTGLVVRGDGAVCTREEALSLLPERDRIGTFDASLKPSPHRVTAKPGYDILFYRDRPLLSYAVKGFPAGSHDLQHGVGVNTYYVEGLGFSPYWPEGAAAPVVPMPSAITEDLRLCQEFDMAYKCTMSMAHCSPFLPAWLVARENLGLEGHQLRRGGATHTSFIKPATVHFHKQGIAAWVKPFLEQPTIFVVSQEDDASLWDDHSAAAVASWRGWLSRRFAGDFAAFAAYVGGVQDVEDFAAVPQPQRFAPDARFGHPMRLAYLKLAWITESFGDYLEDMFAFIRAQAPGVPVTQRYVNWPNGLYASRRARADYNYTYGHLSVEGIPNAYGIGRKPWTGVHAHFGTLPFPRGGSIGKTYSREIRRGPMSAPEWRTNAYTLLANGCCGFEYSTLTPAWGEAWFPAALLDRDMRPTATGEAGIEVMREVLALAPRLLHYERFPDVAVFHDAPFNTSPFAGPWGQSKVGLYALIRETGFHPEPLTEWDMTAANLRGRKILVLGGSLSLAPEVQEAVRAYVRDGGTVVALYCADGQGFPGCNSYAYAVKPRESAAVASFDDPPAVAHLGDVLGLRAGDGAARRGGVRTPLGETVSLAPFNALVEEGRWVDREAAPARIVPREGARVLAAFDDGSPACIEHRYGAGRAIVIGLDLGLVANNLTIPPLYAWWSSLLTELGCRKAVDTGNWHVEAGAWHDDDGNRLLILVNHDDLRPQTAFLAGVGEVVLEPGAAVTRVTQRP